MKITRVNEVFHDLFKGSDYEIAQLWGYPHSEEHFNRHHKGNVTFGAKVKQEENGDYNVFIGAHLHGITFRISPYPACCGIRMLHHFFVPWKLPQETFDQLMKALIEENLADVNVTWPLGASNRLEIVMVEQGRRGEVMEPHTHVPVIENPPIHHHQFYNFFKKYAKKFDERCQYNSNSRNILHNIEVVF